MAAWLVQSLPLETLRWIVLAVVMYSAVSLLRAAGVFATARTQAAG